jgi:hypothetical protein
VEVTGGLRLGDLLVTADSDAGPGAHVAIDPSWRDGDPPAPAPSRTVQKEAPDVRD